MQKKQAILVVASLLVVVLGVTLAYFTAQIIGKGKSVTINSADLKIIFTDSDGSISGTNIEPGKWNVTKTFTIENKSNETYKYNIVIQDLVNTFVTNGYLQYKITSTNNGYNMAEFKDVPKSSVAKDSILAYSASIDVGITQTYTIEFKYANDESVDQSDDMGKTLSGKLFITEGTEEPTLLSQILKDNPRRSTRTTFTAFTETNTGILYKATEQIGTNEAKDVYYFAGDAKNNWVKFGKTTESSCTYNNSEVYYADLSSGTMVIRKPYNQEECLSSNVCTLYDVKGVGVTDDICTGNGGTLTGEKATWNGTTTNDMYWRIIRTNADGSIKLLYAGTSPDSDKAYVGLSEFNTTSNDPMYVGYKYGTSGSLENNRTNDNDSTIKTYIDNWYKNNLIDYTKYLSKDAVYCNDRELASGQTYSTTSSFDYAPYERIDANQQPTYNCTNMSDAFSVNNTSAKLDYPVGLMSIDELSYAGGEFNTELSAPYAWYYTNANGESSHGSIAFLALSPYRYRWSGSGSLVWGIDGSGFPGRLRNGYVASSFPVRPSVSLLSCNLISRGDGSPENPYVVYTGSGVCE